MQSRIRHNDVFGPGPDMRLNACVGRNGGRATFERYSSGYFEAGERLADSIREHSYGVDRLIYPLVLLYRHGIETALKHLAGMAPRFLDTTPAVKQTHKLRDNWKLVRSYLEELGEGPEELDHVESVIDKIIEIDPNGEVFRYPETKDGRPHLESVSLINVDVFVKALKRVATYFDGCAFWFDALYDQYCDAKQWEADYVGYHDG